MVAIKSVIGRIEKRLLVGVRGNHGFCLFHGNRLVCFTKMEHDRTQGLFCEEVWNPATIIRSGTTKPRNAAGSEPSHHTTPAVADDGRVACRFSKR